MFGIALIKQADLNVLQEKAGIVDIAQEEIERLPFHRDVHRLIEQSPEYLEGIKQGVVHLAFNPGWREAIKKEVAHEAQT